jgi:hypothetical protein
MSVVAGPPEWQQNPSTWKGIVPNVVSLHHDSKLTSLVLIMNSGAVAHWFFRILAPLNKTP